jgi:hypothetical protein
MEIGEEKSMETLAGGAWADDFRQFLSGLRLPHGTDERCEEKINEYSIN